MSAHKVSYDRDLRHERVKDENLKGREKAIFTTLFAMMLFEYVRTN